MPFVATIGGSARADSNTESAGWRDDRWRWDVPNLQRTIRSLRICRHSRCGSVDTLAADLSPPSLQICRHDLESLEAGHTAREHQFDELQREGEAARKERETQRALGAGRRGQLDVLSERLQSLDRESARLGREIAAAQHQIEDWRKESATLAARQSELEAAMQQAERELQEALDLRAGGEELLRRDGESLEGERQGARARQEALAAVRREHDVARGEVENLRVALVGLEHDANHLDAEHTEHFGEPLPEVPGELPPNLASMSATRASRRGSLSQASR